MLVARRSRPINFPYRHVAGVKTLSSVERIARACVQEMVQQVFAKIVAVLTFYGVSLVQHLDHYRRIFDSLILYVGKKSIQ